MPNKVFLTGANGLLGNNLTQELVARGYRVVAFVPSGETTPFLDGNPLIEIRRGNLLSYDDVLEAMKDCDAVIHAGANTTVYPARHPMINQVNILGTRHVIKAAIARDIQRMVNVATANIFGYGTLQNPGNEESPFNCGPFEMDYHSSKLKAYQEVQAAVREHGLKAVTVCPTFMLGRFDTRPSSGTLLISLYNGKIPGYSGGGKNYIHVRDVAEGIINAMEYGRIGEAYIFGNQNMDYKSAFNLMLKVMHVNQRLWPFPNVMVKAMGAINSGVAYLTGRTPTISYKIARIGCAEFYYSSEKAIRELNLPQTPIEVAVSDAMQWFEENGYLSDGTRLAVQNATDHYQHTMETP